MGASRREFLAALAGGAAAGALGAIGCGVSPAGAGTLTPTDDAAISNALPGDVAGRYAATRGVVITPEDLSLDWPERAKMAGLTTVALHAGASPLTMVVPFIQSAAGQRFLDRCVQLGLDVEYEVHAMDDLLPRSLFAAQPELFRLDANCQRNPDANFCVHNEQALDMVVKNAVALSRVLRPTNGRYYLWGHDGMPWCECACCKPLSPSDQALVVENRMVDALRIEDPRARVAHLAYSYTWPAPVEVRPADGVFLEFAPYGRRYDLPIDTPNDPKQKAMLDRIDENLAVFGAWDSQVLEYWLDDSYFSGWMEPHVKLPWNGDIFRADVATYRQRGFANITSFAVYLDASYAATYGDPPIAEYGAGLVAG